MLSHDFQCLIRIERVAQTIADVVDRNDADKNHQARKDRQPGVFYERCCAVAMRFPHLPRNFIIIAAVNPGRRVLSNSIDEMLAAWQYN